MLLSFEVIMSMEKVNIQRILFVNENNYFAVTMEFSVQKSVLHRGATA
jgi:hypothetical protein